MQYRIVKRDELLRLKEIDRSEIMDKFYYSVYGRLVRKEEFYNC